MFAFITGGVAIIFVASLIIFPELRKGLKVIGEGFASLFVRDLAKTPEGARAVYQKAIDDCEKKYRKAQSALNRVAGEHDETKQKIAKLEREKANVEKQCEDLYRAGRQEQARTMAGRRAEIVSELNRLNIVMENLDPALEQATNIFHLIEDQYNKLKKEQREVVNELEAQTMVKGIMDELSEIGGSDMASKLLNSTGEYLNDLRKENRGAMVVHANKVSSKMAEASKAASEVQKDAFLAELEAKYGKPGSGGQTMASH